MEIKEMKEKRIQIEGQDTDYLIRDDGTVWSEKRKRILKGTLKRNEYHTVYLSHNGKQYNLMVHRLVAEAFCDNPNNYTIVHHKDENKLNNHAENLEWVTSQENSKASAANHKKVTSGEYYIGEYDENWRPINEFPTYWINKNGMAVNKTTNKILTPCERNGYLRLNIRWEGKSYRRSLHRVVYETFVGPIPERKVIDHIDGDRANNSLSNLRLVTQSENMYNAMANGHSGQIPILQFDKQGNFIQEFSTIQAAADAMGVTHPAIRSAIKRGGSSCGYYWKKKTN